LEQTNNTEYRKKGRYTYIEGDIDPRTPIQQMKCKSRNVRLHFVFCLSSDLSRKLFCTNLHETFIYGEIFLSLGKNSKVSIQFSNVTEKGFVHGTLCRYEQKNFKGIQNSSYQVLVNITTHIPLPLRGMTINRRFPQNCLATKNTFLGLHSSEKKATG